MPSLKLEILQDPFFFKSNRDYPFDYRLIIIHALWYFYEKKKSAVNIQQVLLTAYRFVNNVEMLNRYPENKKYLNQENRLLINNFLEIYEIDCEHINNLNKQEVGLAIIDRSGGIFPLICYPWDNQLYHGPRIEAFRIALHQVAMKSKHIEDNFFKTHLIKMWSDEKNRINDIFYNFDRQEAS